MFSSIKNRFVAIVIMTGLCLGQQAISVNDVDMRLICEPWYRSYHNAIRKYDSNHLILGDRNLLHLQPLPAYAISTMSKYVDVRSVNVVGPRRTVYAVLEGATRHWSGPIHLANTGACVYSTETTCNGFQARNTAEFEIVYSDLMEMEAEHPQLAGFGWCGFYETPPPGARGGIVDVRTSDPLPERLAIIQKCSAWMAQRSATKNASPTGKHARPRLAVLTDIGGDPDDQQSLIRLMLYANEFEIEAMIASASGTPGELDEPVTRPDLIREIVDAYGRVLPNLKKRAKGWPKHSRLVSRIWSGNPYRGRAHIGDRRDTDGSREIIRLVDAGTTERPLNLTIWGGQTDLAQALFRVKHDRGTKGLADFVQKLRVYDIADQDGIADWMRGEFRGLNYILSKAPAGADKRKASFRGMYLTGDESLTSREWIEANIRSKGPLGALYPTKTWTAPNKHSCLKEGDTPSWFFFLRRGGNDPRDPTKPGWGGRFVKSSDGWYLDPPLNSVDPRESVSRHRAAFQSDFAKRMAWCVD